jgi:hypothetical protein
VRVGGSRLEHVSLWGDSVDSHPADHTSKQRHRPQHDGAKQSPKILSSHTSCPLDMDPALDRGWDRGWALTASFSARIFSKATYGGTRAADRVHHTHALRHGTIPTCTHRSVLLGVRCDVQLLSSGSEVCLQRIPLKL